MVFEETLEPAKIERCSAQNNSAIATRYVAAAAKYGLEFVSLAHVTEIHPRASDGGGLGRNKLRAEIVVPMKPKKRVLLCPASESRTEGGRRQESEGAC